jgi:hypothetical protein
MTLRIDRKHMSQPMGGWGIVMPNGPAINDKTVDGLIDKIKAYRVANGMPAGDPEDLIAKAYAPKFPWLIKEVDDIEQFINDSDEFINKLWKSFPLQMAETRTRDDRFAQCEKCKHWEPLDQTEFNNETSRRLILMNPAKSRIEHGWCLLRGWIPSIAVQLHQPGPFTEVKKKHSECWLDAEDKR